jgi:hypothetical protein
MGVDTGAKGFISISSTFIAFRFIGNGQWKGKDKEPSAQSYPAGPQLGVVLKGYLLQTSEKRGFEMASNK